MAITIRTGGNGSYKSAYTAWFVILPALKAGRVVVTNLEGMQPLEVIAERLNITFPSSTKLIRIFSRSEKGIFLWQHFFCWCPLNALIVIDECQDLFSKEIGFDGRKIKYQPLDHFLPMLPKGYKEFFDSRHVPVDMTQLDVSEVDDTGQAEYDESGRVIYPLTYNEGFMRHRKYNWDIELLSPDWQQIASGVKACAEQAFFHKNRDKFFWNHRKPYIFLHATNVAKPVLPKKKDPNLFSEKVPLEAHLLYKSTGTGAITKSGGLNTLFKSPKFFFLLLLMVGAPAYVIYGVVDLLFKDESQVTTVEPETESVSEVVQPIDADTIKEDLKSDGVLSNGGVSDQVVEQSPTVFVSVTQLLPFEGLQKAYLSGFHRNIKTVMVNGKPKRQSSLDIVINAYTPDGQYSLNKRYLEMVNVSFELVDECMMLLSSGGQQSLITCEPTNYNEVAPQPDNSQSELAQMSKTEAMKDNSVFM